MAGLWVALGFDSTPLQFIHVLYEGVPGLLFGQKSLADLVTIYNSYYGKEMHYSAFVIYMLLFYALSINWERVGVVKSKNLVYSFAAMFLAIGCFEWFWILSFGYFQNQPWVYTWQMPQMKILLQNTGFTIAGSLTAVYMLADSYILQGKMIIGRNFTFNLKSWKLWLLIALSVAAAFLWIYYPGPAQQISVPLKTGGVWHSSKLFPQTLYTVDVTPGDAVNAGDWFWVENNAIHALNIIVKSLWAGAIYYFFKVKKIEN